MHLGCGLETANERTVRAGCDRHVRAVGECEDCLRVPRRRREVDVPGDRRDGAHVELRTVEREEDRERIVVARVAVEDHRDRHRSL